MSAWCSSATTRLVTFGRARKSVLIAGLGCGACTSSEPAEAEDATGKSELPATRDEGGVTPVDDGDAARGDGGAPVEPLFEPVWWPVEDGAGIAELLSVSPLFAERPWLVEEASSWHGHVVHETAGETTRDPSRLGYFGVGNGVAFAFQGSTFPLNTLHGMLGPDYQKEDVDGFFSDIAASLQVDGIDLGWSEEWIWKPVKVQMAVTRMRHAGSALELDTLLFAPEPDTEGAEIRCLVQVLNVRNGGSEPVAGVRALLQTYAPAEALGETSIDQLRSGDTMRMTPLAEGWFVAEEGSRFEAPALLSETFELAAGEERQLVVVYELAEAYDDLGAGRAAVEAAGWEALLERSAAWWRAWHEAGLSVVTPDPRVNDLVEGLKGTLRVSIGRLGAATQLSHYTNVWHRDAFPPTRTLLKLGYPDVGWSIPTYLYKAATVEGGIGNALSGEHRFEEPLPEVDWLAKVPFEDVRLLGEGPSFLPLMHLDAWRYTGDPAPLLERWDYLMHALRGQQVTEEGLMPFSGDETFRPPYGYNIDLGLTYAFELETWSAYSGFLFAVACERLADFIEAAGADKPEDLAWLRERAAFVREHTDAAYWLEDGGYYASMIYRESGEPEPRACEDVVTQPLFLAYHGRDHERARANIEGIMALILRDNGVLQTQRGTGEMYGYDLGSGIMTGMAPGYFLFSGAELNLEVAEQTFDALGRYVSPSGNYPEVQPFAEEGRSITPFYDRIGTLGEIWARYRLWEGAINLEAMVHYLVGFEADVTAGWAGFAPRLTHGSDRIEARNARFLGAAVGMRYERVDGGVELSIEVDADPAAVGLVSWRLRPVVPAAEINAVKLDDAVLEPATYTIRSLEGERSELALELPADRASFVLKVELQSSE